MRPELPGPSHTALDFVVNEQDSSIIAKRSQTGEEFIVREVNAAFALHWLDDDRGGLEPDSGFCRRQIVQRDLVKPTTFIPHNPWKHRCRGVHRHAGVVDRRHQR